jgi:hypothetical protein
LYCWWTKFVVIKTVQVLTLLYRIALEVESAATKHAEGREFSSGFNGVENLQAFTYIKFT